MSCCDIKTERERGPSGFLVKFWVRDFVKLIFIFFHSLNYPWIIVDFQETVGLVDGHIV